MPSHRWFEEHIYPVSTVLPRMLAENQYKQIRNNVGILAKYYEATTAMIERDNRSRMLTTESGQYEYDEPIPVMPTSGQDVGAIITALAFWVNQVSESFAIWSSSGSRSQQVLRAYKMLQNQLDNLEGTISSYTQKIMYVTPQHRVLWLIGHLL